MGIASGIFRGMKIDALDGGHVGVAIWEFTTWAVLSPFDLAVIT
jgi:hypothetical protein